MEALFEDAIRFRGYAVGGGAIILGAGETELDGGYSFGTC